MKKQNILFSFITSTSLLLVCVFSTLSAKAGVSVSNKKCPCEFKFKKNISLSNNFIGLINLSQDNEDSLAESSFEFNTVLKDQGFSKTKPFYYTVVTTRRPIRGPPKS